jgi:glucose/arabinose dehydrogenase
LRRLALLALAALAAVPAAAQAAPTLVQVGDFKAPTFVTAPPLDTSHVYVVERAGTIRSLRDGVTQATPFLDITGLVSPTDGERGLLSMAFAPDYATSGRFYVYYTARTPHLGDIQIDEFQRSASNPEVADPASRRPILTIEHSSQNNHNGGQLAFGPDGMLYAGTGDGGGAGDPSRNGQNPATRLGKLLRIDPRPGAALAPADNPYIPSGGDGLVFSIGLRNPYRFSFDRATGDLAIGDVGQDLVEEVDFVAKANGLGRGANYGWNVIEGNLKYGGSGAGQPAPASVFPSGYVGPVITHAHASGWCSVTGGYVLRDAALPELAGRYIYSDFCNGLIYSAVLSGTGGATAVGPVPGLPKVDQLDSFGEDGCGRLYVASLAGPVYRLATTGACAGPAPVPFPTSAAPPAATTPAPVAAPTVIDRRAPLVKLTASVRQRALRRGYVRVSAGCDEQCKVTASAKLNLSGRTKSAKAVGPLRVRSVKRTLAANARVSLRLPIPSSTRKAVRRALAARRAAFVTVTVAAADAAGNRRTSKVRVRIVR